MSPVWRRILMWVAIPFGIPGTMILLLHVLPDRFASVAFLLPIVVIGLIHGYSLADDSLAKWAKAHDIAVTMQNRTMIRRYLLRGRRIRATGAVVGYVSFGLYDNLSHGDELPIGWITATFAGYLLGAAAAEVWAMRPERGAVRSASLAPRDIADYVPRWAVVGVRIAPLATLLAFASWRLWPESRDSLFPPDPSPPDLVSILVWTIGSAVLALFLEATARRVVRRPQPAQSQELVIVDDAIRSTALHGLYGAGLALILGAMSRTLNELQNAYTSNGRIHAFVFAVSFLTGIFAPFVWLHLGIDQAWVVRRGRSQPQVAA